MLITERLDLIPGTPETIRAALEDPARLAAMLGATLPSTWPPELLDAPALEWTLRWYENAGNDRAFGMYWIVLREARSRVLVGVGGFKGGPTDNTSDLAGFEGAPSERGTVELGYGIVAEHQRRGYATETVRAFLTHAFGTPGVTRVIAETLPGLAPSIGVLEKCGFTFIGEGSEPGVIRYEVRRLE